MFLATLLLSAALACAAALSGAMKLRREPSVVEPMTKIGVPVNLVPILATAELAGAAGLLAGLAIAPLGIAAATGLTAYFVGAELAHLRARDIAGLMRPLPLLALSVAALITRVLSG